MKRRPRPKLSPACLRKAQRLAESVWWISAQHAPSRPGEPPEPWYDRLISHRLASKRFNASTSRHAIRWTRQQSVMRSAMDTHLHRYRWQQRLARDPETFQRLHDALDAVAEVAVGADRYIFVNRAWLTLAQAHELFPRKD